MNDLQNAYWQFTMSEAVISVEKHSVLARLWTVGVHCEAIWSHRGPDSEASSAIWIELTLYLDLMEVCNVPSHVPSFMI